MRWLGQGKLYIVGLLLAGTAALVHAQQPSRRDASKSLFAYPKNPQSRLECSQAREVAMQSAKAEHQLGVEGIDQRNKVHQAMMAACSPLVGAAHDAYWRCQEPYNQEKEQLHQQIGAHFAERDRLRREIDEAEKTCDQIARANEAAVDLVKAGKKTKDLQEASVSPAGMVKGAVAHLAQEGLDLAKSEMVGNAYAKRNDHEDPTVAKLFEGAGAMREANGAVNPIAAAVADESFNRLASQSQQTMGDLRAVTARIDGLSALPRRGSSSAGVGMQGAIDRSRDPAARAAFEQADRDNQARDAEALRQAAAAPVLGGLVEVGAAVVGMQGNQALARQMLDVAKLAGPVPAQPASLHAQAPTAVTGECARWQALYNNATNPTARAQYGLEVALKCKGAATASDTAPGASSGFGASTSSGDVCQGETLRNPAYESSMARLPSTDTVLQLRGAMVGLDMMLAALRQCTSTPAIHEQIRSFESRRAQTLSTCRSISNRPADCERPPF